MERPAENSANMVRDSFRQRVLSKHTAFTVLKTKEQEDSLLELQNRFLNDDWKEAPAVKMDEPGLLVSAVLALAFALIFWRRKIFLHHNRCNDV